MAKPICVVYIPKNVEYFNHKSIWETCRQVQQEVELRTNNEYFIFCLPKDVDCIEIKPFLEKDLTEIQYTELKQMIVDAATKPIA